MMKLGLIGNPLKQSWSPAIHDFFLNDAQYRLYPLREDELADFLKKRDFDGINVTIPYKEKVIPLLDELDEAAEEIGAVNCIVNKGGRLVGYNTDWLGFVQMVQASGIHAAGKTAAILGSGGASKAAAFGIRKLGGNPVIVSRYRRPGCITYADLYAESENFQIIVNATPVGMMPKDDEVPVDLSKLHAEAVIDLVANPLRTHLLFDARQLAIPALGGFEMLVRQAAAADFLFADKTISEDRIHACMKMLSQKKRPLVLIGMPTSGKTTLAERIAAETGRELIEMDQEIEKELKITIQECFAQKGEACFRQKESELARFLRTKENAVISCGGGIIKREENMRWLSENGIIIWIQRDLSKLYGTRSRPLSQNHEEIEALYRQRRELYQKYADVEIENNGTIEEAVRAILNKTGENI